VLPRLHRQVSEMAAPSLAMQCPPPPGGDSLDAERPSARAPRLVEWPEEIYWFCGDAEEVCSDAWEFIEESVILVQNDISLGTPDETWAQHEEIAKSLAGSSASDSSADKAVLNTVPRQRWDRHGCRAITGCRPARIRFTLDSQLTNPIDEDTRRKRDAIFQAVNTWNALNDQTDLS